MVGEAGMIKEEIQKTIIRKVINILTG